MYHVTTGAIIIAVGIARKGDRLVFVSILA